MSKKLKAIADAVKAAAVVDGGEDKIGNVAANNNGAADAGSVNRIAKGMKGIVDAADGGKELKDAGAAGGGANGDAGHLFAAAGGGASAAQAGKAAAAVNAVSGEQILKAIVDAAGGEQQEVGAAANAATNPISAAIGAAEEGGNFGADGGMNRNDKIAAAIVLRGMAKNGKFAVRAGAAGADGASVKSAVDKAIEEISKKLKAIADAVKAAAAVDVDGGEEKIGNVDNNGGAADKDSVNGIAKGMKGIVDAADGGKELKGAGDAGAAANASAGHLFAGNAGDNGADAEQAGKAAAAVNAVSGEQILKAIVDAAENAQQEGQGANAATNPISAAIGTAEAGGNFAAMNGNDKIAAAIVLRGMAKDGKFAVQNGNGAQDSVKSAIEKAIEEISKKLKAIAEAAKAAAAVDVGEDKIGNVANNGGAAGTADAGSVNGIAKGMKGIVDAADGGKELKDAGGGGGANVGAGHLFAGAGGSAEQAGKAAAAVNAVSGEQILKAIVDAAGGEQQGQAANAANNPISAAIGAAGAAAAFGGGMNGNDKIAAAIVLRGMAKNGKFAVQAADGASVKSAVDK
ncbi:variable large family protein, partial [Borreliella burgdorferi]|uniref:variable large family protein n=1 Tax=Borreliella burgdorferi TaxID=139 RepID=UPI003F6C9065